MNVEEAYKILEVDADISEKELNKKFRKLAAKYHPDINKEPGAEAKSKQVSEAFNTIKEFKNAPPAHNFNVGNFQQQIRFNWGNNPFGQNKRSNNPFANFFQNIPNKPTIEVKTTISFKESVLGTNKKISYERDVACKKCNGNGYDFDSGSCSACSGQGCSIKEQSVSINGKTQKVNFREECFECEGRGKKKKDCKDCSSSGEKKANISLDVKIPAGILTGQKMLLNGQGHHVFNNQYEDAILEVEVTPEDNMMISGEDVISNIEVSLLDVLKGADKIVKTVHGEKTINIPSKSKNKEQVLIEKAGVANKGSHIFVLNVTYPEDINGLISYLEPKIIEEVKIEKELKVIEEPVAEVKEEI